jgi:hypothetical protein
MNFRNQCFYIDIGVKIVNYTPSAVNRYDSAGAGAPGTSSPLKRFRVERVRGGEPIRFGNEGAQGRAFLGAMRPTTCSFNGFRKSIHPQNRRLMVYYYQNWNHKLTISWLS